MKQIRQILVFPLELVLMAIVVIAIPIDMLGSAVGYLCRAVEGEQ